MTEVLAVFGGSFNPPHVAHAMACLYVLSAHPVDRVLVVPTYRHPFDKALAPFADRMEMCRLQMAPLGDRVLVSDIEAELPADRPSLTLHTLEALGRRHAGAQLRLVIGSDILPERDKWYRWPDVERLAPPIVVARAGHPTPPELGTLPALPAISSTELRARAARGEPLVPLCARTVDAYVTDHSLYSSAPS